MKRILIFFCCLSALNLNAQTTKVPQAVNFQAVARDANGKVIANQNIVVTVTLKDGGANGIPVYCAAYEAHTNDFGSFSFQINNPPGSTITSDCQGVPNTPFKDIDWSKGPKWMQVRYGQVIGGPTIDLGAIEISSVFYAFYARKAEEVTYINPANAQDGNVLKYDAASQTWKPSTVSGGNTQTFVAGAGIEIQTSGNTLTIINKGDTDPNDDLTINTEAGGDLSGKFNDLQIKPAAVGSQEIADGSIQGGDLNPMGASAGQVLKWNGTSWAPAPDNTGSAGTTVTVGNALSGDGSVGNPLNVGQQGASVNQVLKWNGAAWVPAPDNAGLSSVAAGNALSGDGTVGNPLNLGGQNAQLGQVLKWNGSAWVPGQDNTSSGTAGAVSVGNTLSGDGSAGNPLNLAQQGAGSGQVLKWNGATWAPQVDGDNQVLSVAGNQLAISGGNSVALPTGTTYSAGTGINISPTNIIAVDNTVLTNSTQAGGDVSGTFGNLQIKTGVITSDEIANGSIKQEDLGFTISGGGGQWSQNGQKIYYNTGNVGVGINDPLAPLHVVASGTTSVGVVAGLGFANGANGSGANSGQANVGLLGTYNPDAFGSGVVGIGYNGVAQPSSTDIGVYGSALNGVMGVGPTSGVVGIGTGSTGISSGIRGIAAGTSAFAGYFTGDVLNDGTFSIVSAGANNTLSPKASLGVEDTDDGYLLLLDANNRPNVILAGLPGSTNSGSVQVYGPGVQNYISGVLYSDNVGRGQLQLVSETGTKVQAGVTSAGDGQLLVRGPAGGVNAIVGSVSGSANNGLVGVVSSSGTVRAGMDILPSGQGYVFADVFSGNVKNFRMVHPKDSTKEIWYACVEGPECGAYERGTAKMVDGVAHVNFSEHFESVVNPTTMTIILTPLSEESKGMAVVEKTATGFVVHELMKGRGTYEFDWEVKGVRKGYENYKAVRPREPMPAPSAVLLAEPVQTPAKLLETVKPFPNPPNPVRKMDK